MTGALERPTASKLQDLCSHALTKPTALPRKQIVAALELGWAVGWRSKPVDSSMRWMKQKFSAAAFPPSASEA